MHSERLTGFQIAFFIFALSIVCIPLSRTILALLGPGWEEREIFRALFFSVSALVIIAFPRVRIAASRLLQAPIPPRQKREVAWVVAANTLMPLAIAGMFAVWALWQWGIPGPERLISMQLSPTRELDHTFSRSGAFVFFAGVFAAPVIEELVFRGFLFTAWEQRWGWIWSAVLSSTVFAFYHPHFVPAFIGGFIYVAVFRRTGSLSAAIIAHASHNLFLSYPLLGQSVFPRSSTAGFVETWWIQLAALSLASVALPYYLLKAHNAPAANPLAQSTISA